MVLATSALCKFSQLTLSFARVHQHMNSTKWQTLTDFVQYLGKTGKCVVAETDRGFDIQVGSDRRHPKAVQ